MTKALYASASISAVVVTYNRKDLLECCLAALERQSRRPDQILVVDNASTDDTKAWLQVFTTSRSPFFTTIRLPANAGGAGGFAAGLRHAVEDGASWVWMMDDDACPHPDALRELLAAVDDPRNVYGSLAVYAENTSWPTTLIDGGRVVHLAKDIPTKACVESIPLLGFLIHRNLVEHIGYPDPGFFIAADDVEYCMRARRAGADIIVVGNSRIEHPRTQQRVIYVLGVTITYLILAPWKRYYDTRNRLLIARKYYGLKLLTHTIPGSFVRLAAAMLKEPRKPAQLWAWCCGMFDGLLGIKGKRHDKWGIHQ